jgi:hypothetical protein
VKEDPISAQARHRRPSLRLFAATACILTVTVACSSGARHSGASQKSDIKQLTDSMFVDPSSFPVVDGAQWFSPKSIDNSTRATIVIDPSECSPLLLGPTASQQKFEGLTKRSMRSFSVTLAVPTERPDYKALVGRCGTVTSHQAEGGRGITRHFKLRELGGLPDWATVVQDDADTRPAVTIVGVYRGILISASYSEQVSEDPSPTNEAALVKIFNAQVDKLEDAS